MTRSQPKKSRPFVRTRQDHAKETAEDYVEAIAELTQKNGICRSADLSRFFGVSHVTINKTIARLKNADLVAAEPYGPVHLTKRGEKLAAQARERHEIVLAALLTLGISDEQARIDAEGIEHHVSRETLTAFQRLIDRDGRLR